MRFLNVIRGRARQHPKQIVGHIAETPVLVEHNGQTYMVFHLAEAGEIQFRLKMLPMTPLRQTGDHVIVTLGSDADEALIVELLSATRRREVSVGSSAWPPREMRPATGNLPRLDQVGVAGIRARREQVLQSKHMHMSVELYGLRSHLRAPAKALVPRVGGIGHSHGVGPSSIFKPRPNAPD